MLVHSFSGQEEHNPPYSYTIIGVAAGLPNKTTLYLQNVTSGEQFLDSTQIENGAFRFTVFLPDSLAKVILHTKDLQQSVSFWIEDTVMRISINEGELKSAKLAGSKTQADLDLLYLALEKMEHEKGELIRVRKSKTLERDRFDISMYISNVEKRQRTEIASFVKGNHTSMAAVDVLLRNIDLFTKTTLDRLLLSDLRSTLSSGVRNSAMGMELFERVHMKTNDVKVGDKYVDFELPDSTGTMIKLSDIKSDLILLEFWGSGCGPCRVESPVLVSLYRQYRKKGFEILSVSLDRRRAEWLRAIQKDRLNWIQVCNYKMGNDAVIKYGVLAIPDNFLINKDGIVVARNLHGQMLRDKIAELLGE